VRSTGGPEIETESPSIPRERPWLFSCLIAPDAVISLGLASGALTFLLRNEGVAPDRAASIAALIALPHAIYFLWGPITDFWIRRRSWLMIAAAAAALAVLAAFHQPTLAVPWAVRLLFLGACFGVVVAAACGGMMGTLASETNKRRASSFYQSGSLAIGAVAVFLLLVRRSVQPGHSGLDCGGPDRGARIVRFCRAAAIDGPRTRRMGNR
jgi:MFS family permease